MKENSMNQSWESSFFNDGSSSYLESLYESYLADPNSVDTEWRTFFSNLPHKNGAADVSHANVIDHFKALTKQPRSQVSSSDSAEQVRRQTYVMDLINAYRTSGHHLAKLDPLEQQARPHIAALDYQHHGLSDNDLEREFNTGTLVAPENAKLKNIIEALQKTYCHHIGIEYLHITNSEETRWIQQRFETVQSTPQFDATAKKNILGLLTAAEGLEKYLHTKYVGQKRFSLEGGESFIPLLDELIHRAGDQNVKEIVMGMAHRGRLNVLVNVLGKAPEDLFQEFEGKYHESAISGDVKYHMGFSSNVATKGGPVHLALAFNPSHLESVDPVVEGSVRARQERRHDQERDQVLPILIHGDAAFTGQGVVMETFNFSQARGFGTGGTLHIITNNQIGFTTSSPLDARSTLYCTDVAKMVQAPVFHVNADDVEAVIFVTQIALDYRMTFNKDVVIDLVCYRRHGHNEADEPAITQPLMYSLIKKHPTTRQLYAAQLIAEKIIDRDEEKRLMDQYRDMLDAREHIVKIVENNDDYAVDWVPYSNQNWRYEVKTALDAKNLKRLGEKLCAVPADFMLQPQVKKEIENRHKMIAGENPINWGMAETLAYASLVDEKTPVRLTGQDAQRGTFSHRQAVLHDFKNGEIYFPLQHISKDQANITIIDSVLSEEAVLGFEYGYATASPETLVIWEAQFGDFANGAQVVIDQFISSGEQKWGRLCGITMLLPHGYEGQGPEHSSARLERYLQLCAQNNMQVCVPTTAAQVFHMLRRQALRPYRKPLIVMSPKSLLRHKLSASPIQDFTQGEFQVIIPEIDDINIKQTKRLILCSGKVYYELLEKRRENNQDDIAIVRVEQQYPFPEQEITALSKQYKHVTDVVWCQEEPQNQGAWYFMHPRLLHCVEKNQQCRYVGRDYSAAPATGSPKLHKLQQDSLVEEALAPHRH